MKKYVRENYIFLLILGCALVVGTYLRVYMLSSQILLDDEWHSIKEVLGKSYWDVLTQFNPKDNTSPPFNLYNLLLYHSFSWSEFTLRLPATLAGILSLIVLPLLVKRVFDERVSLAFAFLLAISPFLVFYSRFSRAYSLMVLLCFAALLLSYHWLTTGKRRYAVGFVLTSAFAIFVHLFSVVLVLIPLATTFGFGLVRRFRASSSAIEPFVPSLKAVGMVTFIVIAVSLPLSWPALSNTAELPWAKGNICVDGLITTANLISGSANFPLNALFFSLCVAGLVLLFKEKPLLAWTFLCTICAYIAALLLSRPACVETGMVLLRYMIVVVPIALTMVAFAADRLLARVQNTGKMYPVISVLSVGLFVGLLYATGPLPEMYGAPNDFTNHSAFQGSYKLRTWERSDARHCYAGFSVKRNQIPRLYEWLSEQSDIKSIIEYPFDVCNYNNLFYYYQHFHRKRTIAGYCSDPPLLGCEALIPQSQAGKTFDIGIWSADDVLSRVPDPQKLSFRNMVDISDPANVSNSGADVIVLHKFIMALWILPEGMDTIPVGYRSLPYLRGRFEKAFGAPIYEDEQIVCFRIKQEEH